MMSEYLAVWSRKRYPGYDIIIGNEKVQIDAVRQSDLILKSPGTKNNEFLFGSEGRRLVVKSEKFSSNLKVWFHVDDLLVLELRSSYFLERFRWKALSLRISGYQFSGVCRSSFPEIGELVYWAIRNYDFGEPPGW